ncbi:MAG TPA: hypothetical protein VNW97_06735 [Candidatus Saccharimonadales bacterium]|jgi:hypothetical protein|nr:hypothetical protein [Candidatus Saccharimonadales bacterium]
MSTTPETKPGRHSQRVAAWIYTVLNPLVDAIRNETRLLEKANISWRCHTRRSEYIRPIQEYIEAHYSPNLEDFLAENAEFVGKFEEHDNALRETEEQASKFYDILVGSSLFTGAVGEMLTEYESAIGPSHPYIPNTPSLGSMKNDLPRYVAENLINNIATMPTHYTIHAFWERFGQVLRSRMPEFAGYKQRPSFQGLHTVMENLKQTSASLRKGLEEDRLRLCREFDLPAAQPMAPQTTEPDAFRYLR